MKSLNENIGLSGGYGMSHFDGFDVNADAEVIRIKNLLDAKTGELLPLQKTIAEAKARIDQQQENMAIHFANVGGNVNTASYIQAKATEDVQVNAAKTRLKNATDALAALTKEIDDLTVKLADAKTFAIEQSNKIVGQKIALLAEEAKTNPEALKQMTELNAQKLAGEQALAKQKIEADVVKNKSSNIKIYVIVGAVVLGLVAIAGIWIWLKSRKAV